MLLFRIKKTVRKNVVRGRIPLPIPIRVKPVYPHCGICAQTKDEHKVNETYPVQTVPAPDERAERWHIYIHGPITVNKKKFYTIGAVDALTKYMVADVIPYRTARRATNFIINHIFYVFGVPSVITTVQDPEFHSHLMKISLSG